jgi:hypothetical protein
VFSWKYEHTRPMKNIAKYKVEIMIIAGFALLMLFVFVCYHFGIELTDMT